MRTRRRSRNCCTIKVTPPPGSSAPSFSGHASGVARGFDTFDAPRQVAQRGAQITMPRALQWLAQTSRAQPIFLWIHLYDPHMPYRPPKRFAPAAETDWSTTLPAVLVVQAARGVRALRRCSPGLGAGIWVGPLSGRGPESGRVDRQAHRRAASARQPRPNDLRPHRRPRRVFRSRRVLRAQPLSL